jgi:hypothetical protein
MDRPRFHLGYIVASPIGWSKVVGYVKEKHGWEVLFINSERQEFSVPCKDLENLK